MFHVLRSLLEEASGGIILVQERTPEQAAKDILIKTRLEEAFFSTNYDDIFLN